MSLLQIIQDTALMVGVDNNGSTYTSAINGDQTTQQMVAFVQLAGDELARKYDWQALKKPLTFTGDGTTTLWSLPADFGRVLPGEAFWSSKYPSVPLGGVVTDEEWLAITSVPIQPQRPIYRFYQNKFQTYPALASAEVATTQYRTDYWITSSDGLTARGRWVADTDVSLIEERLLTLECIWRFKRQKGFDYSEEYRTAQVAIERAAGQDNGPRTVQMARGIGNSILGTNPFNPIVIP